jgi:hypothetical protein
MVVPTPFERHLFILIPRNGWRKGGSGDRAMPKIACQCSNLDHDIPCPITNMC